MARLARSELQDDFGRHSSNVTGAHGHHNIARVRGVNDCICDISAANCPHGCDTPRNQVCYQLPRHPGNRILPRTEDIRDDHHFGTGQCLGKIFGKCGSPAVEVWLEDRNDPPGGDFPCCANCRGYLGRQVSVIVIDSDSTPSPLN